METVATASETEYICQTPDDTFALGEAVGRELKGGELILLTGGLGAGKTLFTKGVMSSLAFDPDEVSSPSFALVNLYHARLDAYHIDLWRLDEAADAAVAVGLDDILEDRSAVVIVEWAERLGEARFDSSTIRVNIKGDGDFPRSVTISRPVDGRV